jgi:hypothetical protein
MPAHKVPLADRLTSRLVEQDGPLPTPCMIWTGSRNQGGYGQIALGETMIGTHRAAWTLAHGNIPAGYHVHHECEVRACCNVDHLSLMTRREHLSHHGRQLRTTCRRGHPLEEGNLWVDYRGIRACRTCHIERRRSYRLPPQADLTKEVAA